MNQYQFVAAKQAFDALKSNANNVLIDVRTSAEYSQGHAEGALNLPLDKISASSLVDLAKDSANDVFIICQSGTRACHAATKLVNEGHANIRVVEGGTVAWKNADLPIRQEINAKKVLPLDRQVLMVAGLLVLTMTVLGLTVSPWFFAGTLFVGGGLTVAGVTGFCGMALILGKMPWNQA